MAPLPLLLSTALAAATRGEDAAFAAYLSAFNKSYTPEEMPLRQRLFAANARQWAALAAENPHAQFGPTKFSDWTDEEIAMLRGSSPSPTTRNTSTEEVLSITPEDIAAAPASLDWRAQGAVTGIKDQKQCGGCWAFSTIANIEGAAVVQGKKKLVSLSEEMLLDCSAYCGSYRGYFGCNTGCGGGLQGAAFDDLTTGSLKGKAVDSESQYPFTSGGKCSYKSPGVVSFSKWTWIDTDEKAIMAGLAKYGPLAVSVNDGGKGGPWMSYKSGVLTGKGCSGDLNHGVTLVGYGTDGGKDYWLVKNSWGQAWGEEGYIRLARGSSPCQCGVCKSVCTAVF